MFAYARYGRRFSIRLICALALGVAAAAASAQSWESLLEELDADPQPATEASAARPSNPEAAAYLRYLGYLANGPGADVEAALREFRRQQDEPSFRLRDDAVMELLRGEFKQREAQAWKRADADGSASAYGGYIERHAKFPAVHLAEARARLEGIAKRERRVRERAVAQAAARERQRREQKAVQGNLCYRGLKSVVLDSAEDAAAERGIRYPHIYQFVNEPPYWRYVGAGMVGIDAKPLSTSGTTTLRGNQNAEGDKHVTLRLLGDGDIDGIPVRINPSDGAFGFLFFPEKIDWAGSRSRKKDTLSDASRYAEYKEIGLARVLTTVDGDFVQIESRTINGESDTFGKYIPRRVVAVRDTPAPRDRWLGRDTVYYSNPRTEYNRPNKDNLWLRTINADGRRTVEIAGNTRTERELCRYQFGPLAVTNDAGLRPEIERQLDRWSQQYAPAREREEIVHIAKVPRQITGDVETEGVCGPVSVQFSTSHSDLKVKSDIMPVRNLHKREGSYFIPAELYLKRKSLGEIASAKIYTFEFWSPYFIRDFRRSDDMARLLRNKKYQSVEWSDRNANVWLDCDWTPEGVAPDANSCYVRAKRWVLQDFGCSAA